MAFDNDAVIWYLIAGTKGGPNRIHILKSLKLKPQNANQLTKELMLDYKTIRHHLEILLENGLIGCSQKIKYGEVYFLTQFGKEKIEKVIKDLGKG